MDFQVNEQTYFLSLARMVKQWAVFTAYARRAPCRFRSVWTRPAARQTTEACIANEGKATELVFREFPPENLGPPLVTVFEARYA